MSGAWKSVQRGIERDAPGCASPAELSQTIAALDTSREHWPQEAAAEVATRAATLRTSAVELEAEARKAIDAAVSRIAPELERLEGSVAAMDRARFAPLRWYYRWFRIPRLRERMELLQLEPIHASDVYWRALAETREELQRIKANPQAAIEQRLRLRVERVERLRKAAASQEHAGAVAECRVIELIARGLDDRFLLFNDVNVETEGWVYDGDSHRRTAQLDHVVVGPGGVFAIEDKLWSASFAEKGSYYDPYKQIRWAARLTRIVLSDALGKKVRVREIIATDGRLPPKPQKSFAKVLRAEEVCGYIRWFKPELDQAAISVISSTLRACTPLSKPGGR